MQDTCIKMKAKHKTIIFSMIQLVIYVLFLAFHYSVTKH
jgi:hypothetical protein